MRHSIGRKSPCRSFSQSPVEQHMHRKWIALRIMECNTVHTQFCTLEQYEKHNCRNSWWKHACQSMKQVSQWWTLLSRQTGTTDQKKSSRIQNCMSCRCFSGCQSATLSSHKLISSTNLLQNYLVLDAMPPRVLAEPNDNCQSTRTPNWNKSTSGHY